MAETNERIHIDDRTGKRIASPDDATNGGSYSLKGKEMRDWLEAHPDQRELAEPKTEGKAVEQGANKAVKAPTETK